MLGICYMYFLLLLWFNSRKSLDQYHKQYFLPQHFTLQIKGLPEGFSEQESVSKVKELLDKINFKLSKKEKTPIIDIKVAQPTPVFILSSVLDKLLKSKQDLLMRIKESLALKLRPGKNINTEKMKKELLKLLKLA